MTPLASSPLADHAAVSNCNTQPCSQPPTCPFRFWKAGPRRDNLPYLSRGVRSRRLSDLTCNPPSFWVVAIVLCWVI